MKRLAARSLVPLASIAFLVSFTACDKLKAKVTAGDGGSEGGGVSTALATGAGALAFLNGFEGEVSFFVKKAAAAGKPAEAPQSMNLLVKGDKLRLDLPPGMSGTEALGKDSYVVLNTPEKKLYMVMDAKKQVILFDLSKVGEQLKGLPTAHSGGAGASQPAPKVTKTGKTDKVAGYECENWEIVDSAAKKAVLCIAAEGASWFHLPLTGIPTEYAWTGELMDGKHFPLRFVGYDKDGTTEDMRIEVTKIDKKTLEAKLFEIPAGYAVMDLQQAMGAAMGGMPGGMPPGMPSGMTRPPGRLPKGK